jgi:hypothetical protein
VELIDYRPGTGWVRDRVEQLAKDHGGRVVLESRSPAAALGLTAEEITVADAVKASGAFYDGVADQRIKVRSDGRLDAALNAAAKQPVADSWRFGRKSMSDVSPLIAATFAAWAAGRSGAASFMY